MTVQVIDQAFGKNWAMYQGDCVQVVKGIPDNSVDFGIHSPPFAQLYIYSDSEADMGNSKDDDEFFKHYEFLIREMYRITKPGRLCAIHCKDLPNFRNRDGAMGLEDFPGRIIRAFESAINPKPQLDQEALKRAASIEDVQTLLTAHEKAVSNWKTGEGWQYHSRVTIWKDPVIEMERTKNHGLLHRNFKSQAEACRQGMPDYMIVFRKWPIEGGEPVVHDLEIGEYIGTKGPEKWEIRPNKRTERDNHSIAVWQRYASPVWYDIQQTRVLNYQQAKGDKDEKHICPLQLDVISRCIHLWTNKGDVVFSPFAGIGSEGYEAIKMHRKFIGIELKPEYFSAAQKYLNEAEEQASQVDLFEYAGVSVG